MHDSELVPPPTLGPYRLGPVYGRGASAVVYAAVDTSGATWALKWPRTAADAAPLRREAAVLAEAAGPGLVRLHETGECDGVPFLVLERLRGAHLLAGLALLGAAPGTAFERAWPILARACGRVAEALGRLHELGWVHGDLSPRNVLLGDDGDAVLVDAGSARRAGDRLEGFGGTPGFVAPEVSSRGVTGPSQDVYALGALLHAALTGAVPSAPGADLVGRGDVPPGIADPLRRTLLADPASRPSLTDLRHLWHAAAAGNGGRGAPDDWLAQGRTREAASGLARDAGDPRSRTLLAQIAHLRGGDDAWALRRLSGVTTDPGAAPEQRAAAAYQLGRMHATAGRWEAAAAALSCSREFAEAAGDERAAALATNGLAYAMLVAGDAGAALDLLEPLHAEEDALGARIANHRASACYQACLGERALAWRLTAAAGFERAGEAYNLAQCLASLAADRARLGLPLEPEWATADALARRFDVPDVRVLLDVARAEAAWIAGDAEAAAALARGAWDLARRSGRPRLRTGAAVVLADALGALGAAAEAIRVAADAVDSVPCDPGPPLAWEVRARVAGVAERAREVGLAELWRAEAAGLATLHVAKSAGWAAARVDLGTFLAFPRTLAPLSLALDAATVEAAWIRGPRSPPGPGAAA